MPHLRQQRCPGGSAAAGTGVCGPGGRVAHAFGTSLPGWLVVVPRRHVIALDELTAGEAADLGPLLRALTAAMRGVLGCSKTYVALFTEAEAFEHVHFHVVPRSPDMDPALRGPRVPVLGRVAGSRVPVAAGPESWC